MKNILIQSFSSRESGICPSSTVVVRLPCKQNVGGSNPSWGLGTKAELNGSIGMRAVHTIRVGKVLTILPVAIISLAKEGMLKSLSGDPLLVKTNSDVGF